MSKILYVEDNRDTAEAVEIMLGGEGHEVKLAFNGTDGIEVAKNNKFDLILLDIMLPDMSGWDVFTKLSKKVKTRYAFLSALPVSADRIKQLRSAGVSDYIMKPFTKAELVTKVKKILSKKK